MSNVFGSEFSKMTNLYTKQSISHLAIRLFFVCKIMSLLTLSHVVPNHYDFG